MRIARFVRDDHRVDDLGERALALSCNLIGIDSVNPTLVPGSAGEHRIARFVRDRLDSAGFVTRLIGPDDRPSLIATYEGGTGPSVVLNGHLDTVGVDGMPGAFEPRIEGDRLYARGACDMKAGVAGLVVAAETLAAQHFPGRITLALVADEEAGSIGCEAAVATVGVADVCLVAEPTWLNFPIAYRGYAVARVMLRGRAAHSAQPELGRNAVAHLGRLLVAVEAADRRLQQAPAHPAAGHGSLMVTVVDGGTSPFVVAAEATAVIERRTVPGESVRDMRNELDTLLADLRDADSEVEATYEVLIDRDPWQLDRSSAAGRLRTHLAAALGTTPVTPAHRTGWSRRSGRQRVSRHWSAVRRATGCTPSMSGSACSRSAISRWQS